MLNWFKKLTFSKENMETTLPETEISPKVLSMDIVEFDAQQHINYLNEKIASLEATLTQFERSHEDDRVTIYVMDQEIETFKKTTRELKDLLADKNHEINQLKEFYAYFLELYGSGLEFSNWHHQPDKRVPFDEFFDNAKEQMDILPPSN